MSKTVIAPIITVLVLFVKAVFNIDIPDTLVSQITEWVVLGASLVVSLIGVFKNHKK